MPEVVNLVSAWRRNPQKTRPPRVSQQTSKSATAYQGVGVASCVPMLDARARQATRTKTPTKKARTGPIQAHGTLGSRSDISAGQPPNVLALTRGPKVRRVQRRVRRPHPATSLHETDSTVPFTSIVASHAYAASFPSFRIALKEAFFGKHTASFGAGRADRPRAYWSSNSPIENLGDPTSASRAIVST